MDVIDLKIIQRDQKTAVTISSDLFLIGRKESKGPYVPNRDIMKLFTNTPEARYRTVKDVGVLMVQSSPSYMYYNQRCNKDFEIGILPHEVKFYFKMFT